MKLHAPPFRTAPLTLERLSDTHHRLETVPASDPSLAYLLPVPKDWGRVDGLDACATAGRPEIIGIFVPDHDPDLKGPRIIVSATRLRWDVDPASWVRYGWEHAGWSIAMAQPLEPRWHPRFEVGGLRCVGGSVEVRRTTGFVDNGRLLRVDVAGPASTWETLHDVLWPCGVLMSLARPTFRREVEPLLHRGGPQFSFCLPDSWRAQPQPPPWAGTRRWVATPMEGQQGSVALSITATRWPSERPEPIETRQHRIHRELCTHGLTLTGGMKRVAPRGVAGTLGLVGVYATTARDHEEDFELRLVHRDMDGWSLDYTATVASPRRYPLDSMRAIRALEIAVATTETRSREHATHAA